jgi:hypothetical protein
MPIAFSSAGDDADLATVAHQLVPPTRDAAAFDLETDQSLVRVSFSGARRVVMKPRPHRARSLRLVRDRGAALRDAPLD